MAQTTKVTDDEQQAPIAHMHQLAQEQELTFEEWEILFDSMKFSNPPGPNFPDRRADWYDDDGR